MNKAFVEKLNLPVVASLPFEIRETEDGRKMIALEFNTLLPADYKEEDLGKAKVQLLFNANQILSLVLHKEDNGEQSRS